LLISAGGGVCVKGANRLVRLAGSAGLCGLLLLGSIGATTTPPPVQAPAGTPEDNKSEGDKGNVDRAEKEKGNAGKKSEKAEDNNANTAKARFFAIFLKMFQR
jgi:hypothetical protein